VFAVAMSLVLAACGAQASPTPSVDPSARADHLLAGVHLTPTVSRSSLIATTAISDPNDTGDVTTVRVRIVDSLDVALRITADQDVVFAEPPRFCLVGPFSAPDDAGLSDPCWGDPDLAALVVAALPTDAAKRPMLRAGSPVTVTAQLRRGEQRCDYPPGAWLVTVKANPVVDDAAMGARYLADTPFDIPFAVSAPLPLVLQTRYCGLASVIVRDQGEPPVQTP
jgi:hypothetical protein